MNRMSMATRVSILAACAVGLSVAVASLAAYISLRDQLHERMDRSLLERARAASETNLVAYFAGTDIPPSVLGAADLRIFVITADGGVEPDRSAHWLGRPSRAELATARGIRSETLRDVVRGGSEFRAVTVHAAPGTALMFVQSTEPIERTLDRVGLVLLLVGAGGILTSAVLGLAVARSALVPVRRLSAVARHIAITGELTPIQVTGDDELASLATSFNDMLAALQASRDRQRRLVADAGHELRTPLTSLRTNLELLALADRQGGLRQQDRDEIFGDAVAQVEELSTLVGDLVELARDEPLEPQPERIDLADIVDTAIERVRRRAPGLSFDVATSPWWLVGEKQSLERAVTNLLDNAAKWSPPGGTVTVRLDRGVFTVQDQGEGIAEHDLPRVFDRFFRADRARQMSGSGLGLSIVRQAAARHGGTVSVGNVTPHGARFVLKLPGSTVQDEVLVDSQET